ncbi:MAG: hypothetical protein ACI4MC_01075, partial [Candidatus Coproplasma sp.]
IDFIYEDSNNMVLITSESFKATFVVVTFTTNDITLLYFCRPVGGGSDAENDYTLEVQYSGTAPTATASSGGKYYIHEVTTLTFPTS